jgi:hypothetical protein
MPLQPHLHCDWAAIMKALVMQWTVPSEPPWETQIQQLMMTHLFLVS